MVAANYCLTEEESSFVNETLKIIGPEAASNNYCTPFNVLRWIRAYKSTAESAKRLQRHLKIRKIKNLDKLVDSSDEYDKTISDYFPIHIIGRNKCDDNKVLVCEPTGRIDVYHLLHLLQITPFMTNRFRIMEKILRKINELEAETKQISGGILLIDLNGIDLQPSLINILKGPYRIMWGTLFEQYPEMFSQIVIINAPVFMNLLWTTCSTFIDTEIRKKIIITTKDTDNEIFTHIDRDYLPRCYGGNLKCDFPNKEIPSSKLFPQPIINPIVPLKNLIIPAGSSVTHIYQFDKGTNVEFYMSHQDDCTMVILYSPTLNDTQNWKKDDLEEVYAACERPGLQSIDYWQWKIPFNGYYYVCFGNEKAWFLSVSVDYLLSVRHPNGLTTPTAPIAEL